MASSSGGGVYASSVERQISSACCISGAIQHIAGCSGAKHIIVITTDPGAPMMARADYAVVGDLHEVIPALIEALRAREIGLGREPVAECPVCGGSSVGFPPYVGGIIGGCGFTGCG